MNQVTSLVKSSLPGVNINIDDVRVLMTSLDPETARVAGDMLSSLNVTSINMGPSQAHSPYTLQMSPPINMEAEAMVQVGGARRRLKVFLFPFIISLPVFFLLICMPYHILALLHLQLSFPCLILCCMLYDLHPEVKLIWKNHISVEHHMQL